MKTNFWNGVAKKVFESDSRPANETASKPDLKAAQDVAIRSAFELQERLKRVATQNQSKQVGKESPIIGDGKTPATVDTSPAYGVVGEDSINIATTTVQLGERDLRQVARRLQMDPDTLLEANPKIDPWKLSVGQQILLPQCQSSTTQSEDAPGAGSRGSSSELQITEAKLRRQLHTPPDAAINVSTGDNAITITQTIHRQGLYSKLVTTADLSRGLPSISQRLFRRDDDLNPNWTDVTAQAARSHYLNPKGSKKGELSVEWNMPDLLTDKQRLDRIESPGVLGTLFSGYLEPNTKDQTLQIKDPLYRMQGRVLQAELRARDRVIMKGTEFALDVHGLSGLLEAGIKFFSKRAARLASAELSKTLATEIEGGATAGTRAAAEVEGGAAAGRRNGLGGGGGEPVAPAGGPIGGDPARTGVFTVSGESPVKVASPVYKIAGRDVVMVETSVGRQAFYRSSGHNSGRPGKWFPVDEFRPADGWFNKTGYTRGAGLKEGDPLHRLGTEEFARISDELYGMNIPEGMQVPPGANEPAEMTLNRILDFFRGRVTPSTVTRPVAD